MFGKKIRCCCGILLLLVVGCTSIKNTNSNALNGIWIPIKQQIGGKDLPITFFKNQKLEIQGNQYTLTAESVDKGKVEYKKGKMDIYGQEGVNKGKHITAIYIKDANQLTIVYNLKGDGYPSAFDTKYKPTYFLSVFNKSLEQH